MRSGLREANRQFSRLMKAVRGGEEVLLTDRGRPLAVVKPIRGGNETESIIQRLETSGLLRPASRRRVLPLWTPRLIRSAPVSQAVCEERDGR